MMDVNTTWEIEEPTDEEIDDFTKAVYSLSDGDGGGNSGACARACTA